MAMNNTPLDYDLNSEYRARSQQRSEDVRTVNSIEQPERINIGTQLLHGNLISAFLTVVSVIALVIFFGMGTGTASAQDNGNGFSPGNGGGGGDANTNYLYLRSMILAVQEDDLQMARMYAETIIDIDPMFAAPYIGRSHIAMLEEDYNAALEDAQTAYQLYPEDAAVYFVLAEANLALGNYDVALVAYETYLEMVDFNGYQPVLITAMLEDGDSLAIVELNMANCTTAISE